SLTLRPPLPTLFPYTTLFRSRDAPRGPRLPGQARARRRRHRRTRHLARSHRRAMTEPTVSYPLRDILREIRQELAAINIKLDDKDRKSTRLNSSHVKISYAVF